MPKFLWPMGQKISDQNLDPSAGTASVWDTGTTNLISMFSDSDMTVPLTNPVQANAAGTLPNAWAAEGTYDVEYRDANGVTQQRTDGYVVFDTSGISLLDGRIDTLETFQAGFTMGVTASGVWYRVPYPTPMLIQRGKTADATAGTIIVTFPTPFASPPNVVGTCDHASAEGRVVHTRGVTTTTCTFERSALIDDAGSGVPVDWIAIGEAP